MLIKPVATGTRGLLGYCVFKMSCLSFALCRDPASRSHRSVLCPFLLAGLLQRTHAQDHRQPWKLASTQHLIQPHSAHKYTSLLLLLEHCSPSVIKFWTDAQRAALELFRFPQDQWTYLFSSHQYQITSPFKSKIKKKKKCSPFQSQESLPPRTGYIDPIKRTPGANSDFIRVCPEPTIWVGSAIITVEVRGKKWSVVVSPFWCLMNNISTKHMMFEQLPSSPGSGCRGSNGLKLPTDKQRSGKEVNRSQEKRT